MTVPMTISNGAIYVNVSVNGSNLSMILDTGDPTVLILTSAQIAEYDVINSVATVILDGITYISAPVLNAASAGGNIDYALLGNPFFTAKCSQAVFNFTNNTLSLTAN